jgi:hypothetical protein
VTSTTFSREPCGEVLTPDTCQAQYSVNCFEFIGYTATTEKAK